MDTIEEINRNLSPIQQFYHKKSLFISGGTGFFGKVMVEKLLRTCDVECIYLMVRSKKNKDTHSRIEEIFSDDLFDRLRVERPNFRDKVTGVIGDCALPGLGISSDDRHMLAERVHVVIHGAATVKFDEHLNIALDINVRGAKEMLLLGREMKHLEAFIHVSTAFSNCNRTEIEEKFYDLPMSSANALQLGDCLDEKTLVAITPEILGTFPNTYVFTKSLAEDVVRVEGKGMPVVLYRPAIVIPTYLEPVPGWINNFYGPTGIVVAVAIGVLRVLHCVGETNAQIVPVDMCVNSILASGWDVAKNKYDSPPVYNYVGSQTNTISWKSYMEINSAYGKDKSLSKAIWFYSLYLSPSKFVVMILQFFLHVLPAAFVDFACIIAGKKFRMLKVYKKIHKFCDVLSYFATQQWKFESENVKSLWAKLDPQDQQLFFFDMDTLNWTKCLQEGFSGIRRYLMKDDDSTIKSANRKSLGFKILHYTLMYALRALVCYLLYKVVVMISTSLTETYQV